MTRVKNEILDIVIGEDIVNSWDEMEKLGLHPFSFKNGWVPVKDRLPEIGRGVLLRLKQTHWKSNCILHTVASLEKYEHQEDPYFNSTEGYNYDVSEITHWCEIPTLLNGDD